MVRLVPMTLIMVSLLFLCIPGIIYNNLNNNGLVVAQSQALVCSPDPQTPTCQISGNVGCQANSANCQLSGSSISFLNSKSPFTQLLSGNIFALFTNINPLTSSGVAQNSWSGTHGPFDVTGNPNFYYADCQGSPTGGSRSQTKWALGKCTQSTTDGFNVTKANVVTWNNWNTSWNSTKPLLFYQLGNATFGRSCVQIAQINYTLLANGPGYTYFGCLINDNPTVQSVQFPTLLKPTHHSWSILVAMPVSYGITAAAAGHQVLFVQLENWDAMDCIPNFNLNYYGSVQCTNFLNGFKGTTLPCPQTSACVTFVPNTSGGIVFGFLAGVILLVLGLGLQFGFGAGVSAGSNEQGTRLAQVVGIGLIVWSFLYSQFATWFTSGILPYGFDGALGIVSVIISGMFFVGAFWQTMSRN